MSQKLSKQDISKIADLIKITVPEQELDSYASQLNTVLDAVPVLEELETKEVKVTAQTHGLTNVLREDVTEPGLDMQEYPNTQNFKNGSFIVDKVL